MVTIKTTRVRPEWVDKLRDKYGTDVAIAEKLGVDKSTVGRWLKGDGEASGRFIGAVLLTFPITFDDAFVCVEEIAERRRARVYKRATGRPVASAA